VSGFVIRSLSRGQRAQQPFPADWRASG
jgi:hypothetical protein